MNEERRINAYQAKMVKAAIGIDALWGCVNAWHYLLSRGITRAAGLTRDREPGVHACILHSPPAAPPRPASQGGTGWYSATRKSISLRTFGDGRPLAGYSADR